jgi:protein TonB
MEINRITHILTGMVLSIAGLLCFLEYKSINANKIMIVSNLVSLEDEEVVEINPNTPPPPPPPPPAPPEVVKVVKDEQKVENKIIIIDQEAEIDIVIEVEEEPEPVVEEIFDVVEENPEFVGGMAKLYEYLGKNIQYPEMAKENGIQGKVFVQFVVWKDGTIRDVKVVKGVHKTLDNEANRVIKTMPQWTPGKQRGKAVNARFTLPIKFKIS